MQIKLLQVGPLGTNCYLLEDEKNKLAAVVDPGGDALRILSQAQADGVEIRLILLTHAPFDHTGGVAGLHASLPDVPVYLHPADAALLGNEVFPAIGVPTVVDAATVAMDLTGCDDPESVLPSGRTMMVTPREIDLLIDRAARLVAMKVNKKLQPAYSPLDLVSIAG